MRNIIAMAVPLPTVNDIFFTHLHVDHYADLPYRTAFAPWVGRWKPLRVHGPSGRTPQDGIGHMIEGMKMMTHWHTDSFKRARSATATTSRSASSIIAMTTASATTRTA
jgi:ribonuclease BN (tRNA processing enzyme)